MRDINIPTPVFLFCKLHGNLIDAGGMKKKASNTTQELGGFMPGFKRLKYDKGTTTGVIHG